MDKQPDGVPKEVIEHFMRKEAERVSLMRAGIHIPLVPPIIFKGKGTRAFGSRVYTNRPVDETFHMFLTSLLQVEIGKDWWDEQQKLPVSEHHFIATCFEKFNEWVIKNQTTAERCSDGKMWGAVPDGYAKSLLILAFDVVSLTHMMKLLDSLLRRLKSKDGYQGVRYEIAIAAIFARLGCDIQFTDENSKSKHCEFITTHRATKFSIAVEAKSKHRTGVLHQLGLPDSIEKMLSIRSVRRLFNAALEQNPKDVPFAVFIDVNSPITPDVPLDQKPWVREAKALVEKKLRGTAPQEYPLSAAFFTNFSYHYQTENEALQPESVGFVIPHPKFTPPDDKFFTYLLGALTHYGFVPPVELEERKF